MKRKNHRKSSPRMAGEIVRESQPIRRLEPHAAGLDIGAAEIAACVSDGEGNQIVRMFGTYTRLYLRAKKVRHLNRERSKDKCLSYRSKYTLAREMLLELEELLPAGSPVYVLFDSWYASAKLINLCLRRRWQVICALKSNRQIEKQRIDRLDQTLKPKPYQKITLEAVGDRRAPTYSVRTIRGHLEKVRQEVYLIISKKRPGDPRPKYFLCTDTHLTAEEALKLYQKRWPVEVDNLNLKEVLGLGDFRLQSFEAIQKWFVVATLAINYLQYTAMLAYRPKQALPSLSECKRLHQQVHLDSLLRRLVTEIKKKPQRVETLLQAYLPMYAAGA